MKTTDKRNTTAPLMPEVWPSIEEQATELLGAGWARLRGGRVWKAPNGGCFRGPHGAWLAMKDLRDQSRHARPVTRYTQEWLQVRLDEAESLLNRGVKALNRTGWEKGETDDEWRRTVQTYLAVRKAEDDYEKSTEELLDV